MTQAFSNIAPAAAADKANTAIGAAMANATSPKTPGKTQPAVT